MPTKPCRALALRLGTDRVQFEKRLPDAVLNAVERAGLQTDFQTGNELAEPIGQAINHTRRCFAGLAIGAGGEEQERNREADNGTERYFKHAIHCCGHWGR